MNDELEELKLVGIQKGDYSVLCGPDFVDLISVRHRLLALVTGVTAYILWYGFLLKASVPQIL